MFRFKHGPTWLMMLIVAASTARGQIVTDGTVGAATTLSGPDFQIGSHLGRQQGGNLYHSFQSFNVHQNESATFSGPNSVNNVLARVTGGDVSQIRGVIRTEGMSNANLFLMNPAGIIIGEGAEVDIPGSFYATTADQTVLGNNEGVFDATNPAASSFSAASPSAFGFYSATTQAIVVEDSDILVDPGESFSLVAGDVQVVNSGIAALDGKVNLHAAGPNAIVEVDLNDGETHTVVASASPGEVFIQESSVVADVIQGEAEIHIRGGRVVLENAEVVSLNSTGDSGPNIEIDGTSEIVLRDSYVVSENLGDGEGGSIELKSSTIIMEGADPQLPNQIITFNAGSGEGGSIHIEADNLVMTGYSDLISDNSGDEPGDIAINVTDTLQILGSSVIQTFSNNGASGDIEIFAPTITMDVFADISTFSEVANANGDIFIVSFNSVLIGFDDPFVTSVTTLEAATLIEEFRSSIGFGDDGVFYTEFTDDDFDYEDYDGDSEFDDFGSDYFTFEDTESFDSADTGYDPNMGYWTDDGDFTSTASAFESLDFSFEDMEDMDLPDFESDDAYADQYTFSDDQYWDDDFNDYESYEDFDDDFDASYFASQFQDMDYFDPSHIMDDMFYDPFDGSMTPTPQLDPASSMFDPQLFAAVTGESFDFQFDDPSFGGPLPPPNAFGANDQQSQGMGRPRPGDARNRTLNAQALQHYGRIHGRHPRGPAASSGINGFAALSNGPFSTFSAEKWLVQKCVVKKAHERSTFRVAGRGGIPLAPTNWLPSFHIQPRRVGIGE